MRGREFHPLRRSKWRSNSTGSAIRNGSVGYGAANRVDAPPRFVGVRNSHLKSNRPDARVCKRKPLKGFTPATSGGVAITISDLLWLFCPIAFPANSVGKQDGKRPGSQLGGLSPASPSLRPAQQRERRPEEIDPGQRCARLSMGAPMMFARTPSLVILAWLVVRAALADADRSEY